MLRAYKTEINPTPEQKEKIHQSLGICRYLYNAYLSKNIEAYQSFKEGKVSLKPAFIRANAFDKYINHEVKTKEEYAWINLCGSKARKKAICNAEAAFVRFWKGQAQFPKFKKKNRSDVTLYFPKNNSTDWKVERNKISIPTLKWVYLKEKGYIPTKADIVSGTVSVKAGRYYVSVVTEVKAKPFPKLQKEGVGIDLGLKEFAVVNNLEKPFQNINKTRVVKQTEKKLKRAQRKLSRKYESLKSRNNKEKGEATRQNISRQLAKVQRLHQRLSNIRENYLNQTVRAIVKQKPRYITIEDLNIKGMMKNRHLSKAISKQGFFTFRVKLKNKCSENGIELRVVDRFYPSSRTCSSCGHLKKDLKLSDRAFVCPACGSVKDRDKNASCNLRDAKVYHIA